jgi:hypothetical protein
MNLLYADRNGFCTRCWKLTRAAVFAATFAGAPQQAVLAFCECDQPHIHYAEQPVMGTATYTATDTATTTATDTATTAATNPILGIIARMRPISREAG